MSFLEDLQNATMGYSSSDIALSDLRIGSVVMVYNRDSGKQIQGTIDDLERNGKNGVDTVSYTSDKGDYWAYIDQVKSIVKY